MKPPEKIEDVTQEMINIIAKKVLNADRELEYPTGEYYYVIRSERNLNKYLPDLKLHKDLNHCMMLVESEWFKNKYRIIIGESYVVSKAKNRMWGIHIETHLYNTVEYVEGYPLAFAIFKSICKVVLGNE